MKFMLVLFSIFCVQFITSVWAACPAACSCDTDRNGRKRVRCDRGQLNVPDTFTPQSIDKNTEVLRITAPSGKENTIERLSPPLFKDLNLIELHLTNSKLRLLGDCSFYYLSNTLRVLNLANNDLVDISENNFRNLSGLTHLHLDNNQISSIHSATFNYQRTLKVLTLSNNRIYDLGTRSLLQQQGSALEVVDLSGNPLGEVGLDGSQGVIPELIFQDVPNLRIIRLANTSIARLPFQAMAKSCKYLEELDLANNKFTSIVNSQFSELKSLRRLNLAGNPITEIQAGSFRGLMLTSLDLSALKLAKFQSSMFDGVKIDHLSIANNGLTSIDADAFRPVSLELTGLDVGGNPLTLKEKMFQFAPNLKSLSLCRMRIARLPVGFLAYDHKIVSLNVSWNAFQDLSAELLTAIPNLEVLDISHNEFQRLPLLISKPTLRELYASFNQLQNVPGHIVDELREGAGKVLKVDGNSLECNWRVAALANWLSTPNGRTAVCGPDDSYQCPVCATPEALKSKPVDKLRVSINSS